MVYRCRTLTSQVFPNPKYLIQDGLWTCMRSTPMRYDTPVRSTPIRSRYAYIRSATKFLVGKPKWRGPLSDCYTLSAWAPKDVVSHRRDSRFRISLPNWARL